MSEWPRCPFHGFYVEDACPLCGFAAVVRPPSDSSCPTCGGSGKRYALAQTLAVSDPEAPCPDCATCR